MASCTGDLLSADITGAECDKYFVAGLASGAKALIFNFEDVATKTKANGVVTAFTLLDGKTGYDYESFKRQATKEFSFVSEPERPDGYVHTFTATMNNPNAANMEQVSNIRNGKRVIIMVQNQWEGTETTKDSKYTMLGFDHGLILTDFSQAADGAPIFTMATEEGLSLEADVPAYVLITDIDATDTLFNNKFASA